MGGRCSRQKSQDERDLGEFYRRMRLKQEAEHARLDVIAHRLNVKRQQAKDRREMHLMERHRAMEMAEELARKKRLMELEEAALRMRHRRLRRAMHGRRGWFFRAVCCKCSEGEKPFSWVAQPLVDSLEMSETDKAQVWEYFVNVTERLEMHARRSGWWLYTLQLVRTTFNIILPAILALQNVGEVSFVLMWFTWGLSLAVSLATGYIDLFSLRSNYEMFSRATEYLRVEGWWFFSRTGRYKAFETHHDALPTFMMQVAKIRRRLLDHQFPPRPSNGGAGEAGSGGSAGSSTPMYARQPSMATATSYPPAAVSSAVAPVSTMAHPAAASARVSSTNNPFSSSPPQFSRAARSRSLAPTPPPAPAAPPPSASPPTVLGPSLPAGSENSSSTTRAHRFEQAIRAQREYKHRLDRYRREAIQDDNSSRLELASLPLTPRQTPRPAPEVGEVKLEEGEEGEEGEAEDEIASASESTGWKGGDEGRRSRPVRKPLAFPSGRASPKELPSSGRASPKELPSSGQASPKELPCSGQASPKELPSSGQASPKDGGQAPSATGAAGKEFSQSSSSETSSDASRPVDPKRLIESLAVVARHMGQGEERIASLAMGEERTEAADPGATTAEAEAQRVALAGAAPSGEHGGSPSGAKDFEVLPTPAASAHEVRPGEGLAMVEEGDESSSDADTVRL
jgi:hypothetical protein